MDKLIDHYHCMKISQMIDKNFTKGHAQYLSHKFDIEILKSTCSHFLNPRIGFYQDAVTWLEVKKFLVHGDDQERSSRCEVNDLRAQTPGSSLHKGNITSSSRNPMYFPTSLHYGQHQI